MAVYNYHTTDLECSTRRQELRDELNVLQAWVGRISRGEDPWHSDLRKELAEHHSWAGARARELDAARNDIQQLREQGGAALGRLEEMLDAGLHNRLMPIFQEQLGEIEKKLNILRELERSVLDAGQQSQTALRQCEGVQTAVQKLDSTHQQWSNRFRAELIEQMAAASASLEKRLSEAKAAFAAVSEAALGEMAKWAVDAKSEMERLQAATADAGLDAQKSAKQSHDLLASCRTSMTERLAAADAKFKEGLREIEKAREGAQAGMEQCARDSQAEVARMQSLAMESAQTAQKSAKESQNLLAGCNTFLGRLRWLLRGAPTERR